LKSTALQNKKQTIIIISHTNRQKALWLQVLKLPRSTADIIAASTGSSKTCVFIAQCTAM